MENKQLKIKIPSARLFTVEDQESPFRLIHTQVKDIHAKSHTTTTQNTETNMFFNFTVKLGKINTDPLQLASNLSTAFQMFVHLNYTADTLRGASSLTALSQAVTETVRQYTEGETVELLSLRRSLREESKFDVVAAEPADLLFMLLESTHAGFAGEGESCEFQCLAHKFYFLDIERLKVCKCYKVLSKVSSSTRTYFFELPLKNYVGESIVDLFRKFRSGLKVQTDCKCGSKEGKYILRLRNKPNAIIFDLGSKYQQNRRVNACSYLSIGGKFRAEELFEGNKGIYFFKSIVARVKHRFIFGLRQDKTFSLVDSDQTTEGFSLQWLVERLVQLNASPCLVVFEKLDEMRASYLDKTFLLSDSIMKIGQTQKSDSKPFSAREVKKRILAQTRRCPKCGKVTEDSCKSKYLTRLCSKKNINEEAFKEEHNRLKTEGTVLRTVPLNFPYLSLILNYILIP